MPEAVEIPREHIDAVRRFAEWVYSNIEEPNAHLSFPVSEEHYIDIHFKKENIAP